MRLTLTKILLLCLSLTALLLFDLSALARDNASEPEKSRPTTIFDHTLHEEALEEPGCGACHHVFDDEKGSLIYSEGEESNCSECHFATAENDVMALREANHASCTACHRDLIKRQQKAGPTTCGECHKKQP